MKCPNYSPLKDGSCLHDGTCPCHPDANCSHGWIPFWTESERAGLKAMGKTLKFIVDHGIDPTETGIDFATCAYVSASRRVKEGK